MAYQLPPGRPYAIRSVTQLKQKIQSYFDKCDEEKKPYTISGMALQLNVSRQTLHKYESNEKFADTIKWAKAVIEDRVEQSLLSGKGGAGAIFWLKNQGWSDKQEIEVNDITNLTKDELIKKIREKVGKPEVIKQKKVVNR